MYAERVTVRHPPIEPYALGMLDVGDGQQVYWECCGNPHGKPALFLHGGPGAGCGKGARRFFDPRAYRIVLFDQRGCGRSRPLVDDPNVDLRTNTTQHLISDIEQLREHLRVEQWTTLGVSWGSTLALAYAQAHPSRVRALVLGLVTTTSRHEVNWMTHELGRLLPEQWARFTSCVPRHLYDMPLVDAYATMLDDADANVRAHAAKEWCTWDCAQMGIVDPRFEDASFRMVFARLVTHYWRHAAFLGDEQLIRDAAKLEGIPGVLIHGRHDVSCPLDVPWRLSRAWKSSELRVIESGHGDADVFPLAVTAALDALAETS